MKRKQIHRQTIRFRRRSRKSYVAFASIGKRVAIGCLRENVADSSLRKQGAVQTILCFIYATTTNELKAQILVGVGISPDQVVWLANIADRGALYAVVHEIIVQCVLREFDMRLIINAKSGRRPENCKWRAQFPHYHTKAEIYNLLPAEECLKQA